MYRKHAVILLFVYCLLCFYSIGRRIVCSLERQPICHLPMDIVCDCAVQCIRISETAM